MFHPPYIPLYFNFVQQMSQMSHEFIHSLPDFAIITKPLVISELSTPSCLSATPGPFPSFWHLKIQVAKDEMCSEIMQQWVELTTSLFTKSI